MIDIRLIFRRVRTKGLSSGWCECWCWSRNRAGGGNGGVSDGRAGVVAGVVVGLEVVVLLKWGLEIVDSVVAGVGAGAEWSLAFGLE
jgi:hypothetical protein